MQRQEAQEETISHYKTKYMGLLPEQMGRPASGRSIGYNPHSRRRMISLHAQTDGQGIVEEV